ncbi:MAG TPA: Ni/Fe hydrogenase subunit alpha [Candidatus Uhrbacteria bacterium]|nr:Ni/Fe hydrogenase subunit alpha [Candidatus Uhrbacteria bacterium]
MSKIKTIKINHIAKMEGHTGFVAHILDGNVIKAKMETKEGARLIEGVLLGRDYYEAPIITGRICGICPIVHFLSSAQAIEQAFRIKVSDQTVQLRKVMELLQIIHSHALHVYFLSLPDFFDIENDLNFIKKYPKETKAILRVRQFAIDMVKLIGGRTVHPLTMVVGGFKKLPDMGKINKMLVSYAEILEDALLVGEFTRKIKYPKFSRKTEFVSLYNFKEYEVLCGDIINSEGKKYKVKDFYHVIEEFHHPFEKVKRTAYRDKPYFSGALARVNNNFDFLNPYAKKLWQGSGFPIPSYNTFHNVFAQAVEIVHCLEEINKIFKQLGKIDQKNTQVKVLPKAGEGWGAVEAPRGILLDYYKLDKKGKILEANIITPTAQFLANLEADLKVYLPDIYKLPIAQRRRKIRTLVRAYDPCISCATH